MILGICSDAKDVWQFIGICVTAIKIIIPIIIIVLGIIELAKAVLADDSKEITKAATALLKKFIAAVVIFFIPTLVKVLFGLVPAYGEVKDEATICINCIAAPNSCK